MPLDKSIKKVLLIGSGPIVIGQAAEFDYAGTQACKVLKEEGINTLLLNSNPATIMTDKAVADEIYLEPLTIITVKRIIEKERPDALLAGLGGQTGLNIGVSLAKEGYLQKMGVRLIGTNADAIDRAEDRDLFKKTMEKIGMPVIPSGIANSVEEAVATANETGYPVIIRPAFTLGGGGGGVAYNEKELIAAASTGLLASPIGQILVEKYIYGWKEIEFEVMRDSSDTAIAICSMENVDPVGIHTGDSIVVAPALTLGEHEYTMLKNASLDIIRELKIEGGCNCQFALNTESSEFAVIEVNPRVSRSSALASKATGYPIAKVTTKIALGYTLDEIKSDLVPDLFASCEPDIDYVVLKMPKWPFEKFHGVSHTLGTQMKATGEVMSIAPNFEMALLKAVRGAEIAQETLDMPSLLIGDILKDLVLLDDLRIFRIYKALKMGISIDKIYEITKIDRWFLHKINNLCDYEKSIANKKIDESDYLKGKNLGYTDRALLKICKNDFPFKKAMTYREVDSCAGKHKASAPYFYSAYFDICESREISREKKERVIVLGSGPIRIGQGIEFDYSSVHCARAFRELGYEVIIINNNPETVSTDFDACDRLYFEPLCEEDVLNIIEIEKPWGVVVAFGGQTAIKLTKFLTNAGVNILGTSADSIDMAEDRERFDALLESFSIRRPKGLAVFTKKEALQAANELGYPVLVRPSYVIGGQNMTIAYSDNDVEQYMDIILASSIENPVLIDKYLTGTELEVDVICDGEEVLIPGIMEHVERAGIHSGDSIAMYPHLSLTDKMLKQVCDSATKLAVSMNTRGLINIQYLIYENELFVIEVNPRASRTVPYISKVSSVNMVEIASKIMAGQKLRDMGVKPGLLNPPPYFAAKVPVFSFEKLMDANSTLGPEMKSTGEVLGIGKTREEALYKGLLAAGFKIPEKSERKGMLISLHDRDKPEAINLSKNLYDLGIKIYATDGTADEIERLGIEVIRVKKLKYADDIKTMINSGEISYIVYTGDGSEDYVRDFIALHALAMKRHIACLTSIDTANALVDIIKSRFNESNTELVDINRMRKEKRRIPFWKMVATGNDYIYVNNFDLLISCPESLAITLCDRNFSIGGDGLVLIENSDVADAKMRMFNKDGSEGEMAGNSVRCVGKYLYDRGIVQKEELTIETKSGVKSLKLYIKNGEVGSVSVDMGRPFFKAADVPAIFNGEEIIDEEIEVGGGKYRATCLSVGNPHCVVFCGRVDGLELSKIGPLFEHDKMFPNRVNTEFVRVVNSSTLKMRVWERGNGETLACGTGACAAAAVAIKLGLCDRNKDITVKVKGGDLIVSHLDGRLF